MPMLLPYFTNEGVEHVIHVPPVRCARLIEGAAERPGQVLALPGDGSPPPIYSSVFEYKFYGIDYTVQNIMLF